MGSQAPNFAAGASVEDMSRFTPRPKRLAWTRRQQRLATLLTFLVLVSCFALRELRVIRLTGQNVYAEVYTMAIACTVSLIYLLSSIGPDLPSHEEQEGRHRNPSSVPD